MVVRRKRKVFKYRGHTTHGGGARKKRRGAGSRGGRGNAGTGKRAGHKAQGVILGKRGFKPRTRNRVMDRTINVGDLYNFRLIEMEKSGQVKKEGGAYVIDLAKLGYSKLLGTGKLESKLKIVSGKCSKQAAEKVKAAGGSVEAGVSSESD